PAVGSHLYFQVADPFDIQPDAQLWQATWVPSQATPGDFDGDGDVDGADFRKWQRGESPNPLSQSDLADWEANYGATASLSANSTHVPEPSTLLLSLLGLSAVAISRQSNSRLWLQTGASTRWCILRAHRSERTNPITSRVDGALDGSF
ncbi:MAG: PEP-CTERM sorting domain-containing protein, partial [Aeoliella sp.]